METRINYTAVGAFVILLSVALIIIAIWLSAGLSNKQYDTYLAIFDEAVTGLTTKAPVKYNGVDVGFVDNIHLDHHDPSQVLVRLKIEDDVAIKTTTIAVLNTQGLTGVAYINLKGGTNGAPILKAVEGQPYPIIKTAPSSLFQLENAVTQIANNITQVSKDFKSLVGQQNQQNIQNLLTSLAKISNTFANNSVELNQSIKNANIFLRNTAQASQEMPEMIKNLNQASLITTNTLKAFSNEAMPQTLQAINNLQSLLTNLQQLANKIQQNPAILVRGEQSQPLGPGE